MKEEDARYEALRKPSMHSDSSTEVEFSDKDNDHDHEIVSDSDNDIESKPGLGHHHQPCRTRTRTRRTRTRRRKGIWNRVMRYRWVFDTALLLVILGLLVDNRWSKAKKQKGHRYELGGDITGFAPQFSQQLTRFTPDHRFVPEPPSMFWSKGTQDAWLSIVPKGLGYLLIKSPELYTSLPQPLHDYSPNSTVYTTSMTHQLHCLYTILDAYNTLTMTRDPTLIKMPWHVNHCFEYMRQAIQCTGDVALEGAATTFPLGPNGEDQGGSDGWDSTHVCRNFGEVYDYLEKETVPGARKWISS
ncbi:hypothetical protein K504DRAFT_480087 [Pleomassaria siparia CBS 279.74]|uniref:Uncharacterized protein n=1 Tax=Pleomassaria siparia CBS 279.74 TaxID=1314801 RepID=A0A6G1KIP2_9PLEO|nr:hypothetical protein K504DRAFT_480087 [Pleomassaria siparia CBS 279.74]